MHFLRQSIFRGQLHWLFFGKIILNNLCKQPWGVSQEVDSQMHMSEKIFFSERVEQKTTGYFLEN